MKFKIAVVPKRLDEPCENTEFTWEEFAQHIATPIRTAETYAQYQSFTKEQRNYVKNVGGFIAGESKDGKRKADSIVNRCMVTLDLDHVDPMGQDKMFKLLDGLGYKFLAYPTRNYTPTEPRLRIIVPTNRVMTLDEYEPVARKIADIIGIDFMDSTTFQANRIMYWSSCSIDAKLPQAVTDNGNNKIFADVDDILHQYVDWRNVDEWPKVPNENEIVLKDNSGRKQQDPLEKDGIVGAFCRVYDIHSAIENFLSDYYEHGDKPDKYTHIGSKTENGATVYDDGRFLYSYHETDRLHYKTLNSFDLVREYKFGDLDEKCPDAKGATRQSYKKMEEFAKSIPEVHKEYEKAKLEKAQKEFEQNPEKGLTDLFFENGKFDIEKFCNYLIENEHVCIIDDRLHIYSDGIYVEDETLIQRKMIKLVPKMLDSKRTESLKYLKLLAYADIKKDDINYIAFKNRTL